MRGGSVCYVMARASCKRRQARWSEQAHGGAALGRQVGTGATYCPRYQGSLAMRLQGGETLAGLCGDG